MPCRGRILRSCPERGGAHAIERAPPPRLICILTPLCSAAALPHRLTAATPLLRTANLTHRSLTQRPTQQSMASEEVSGNNTQRQRARARARAAHSEANGYSASAAARAPCDSPTLFFPPSPLFALSPPPLPPSLCSPSAAPPALTITCCCSIPPS